MQIESPFVTREVLMTLKSILLRLFVLTSLVQVGCAGSDAQGESGEEVTKEPVSYTHLTLPTTPYV